MEDLEILRKYFTIKEWVDEEEHKMMVEIHEEYEAFMEIHFYYAKERGRILTIRPYEGGDYDEMLLFSPLGTVEISSSASPYEPIALQRIIEKILNRNIEFRNSLTGNLCEARRKFNAIFRNFFRVDYDFFTKCESIIEINPFCKNRNDFMDLARRISDMMNSFDKKEIEKLLNEKVKGSIDALEKIFQKAGKKHAVGEECHKLRVIHNLRNTTPVHPTDKYFAQFLREFGEEYPKREESWCDFSILVLHETTTMIDRMSKVLKQ